MLNLLESTSLFSVESVHSQWFPKNPSFPRLQIQSYIADHLKLLWQNLLVYYLYFNIYLIFLFSLAMKHFLILLLEYLYLFFFFNNLLFLMVLIELSIKATISSLSLSSGVCEAFRCSLPEI